MEDKSVEKHVIEIGHDLQEVLKEALPRDTAKEKERLDKLHEPKDYLVEDKVAVLDISTAALADIDCIPGYYFEKIVGRFTAQGLQMRYKYEVVIKYWPSAQRVYDITVKDRKEWEDDVAKSGQSGGMPQSATISAIMLRRGGDADEAEV